MVRRGCAGALMRLGRRDRHIKTDGDRGRETDGETHAGAGTRRGDGQGDLSMVGRARFTAFLRFERF